MIEYDHEARVLVGSANATDAAFGGNVELLAELSGSKHRFGIASMVGEDAEFADNLEPYSRSEEPPPEDDPTLADLLRRIAGIPLVARVSRDAAHYRLDVSATEPLPTFDDGTRITMEPLTVPGRAIPLAGGVQSDVAFPRLQLTQVTPFFAVHATAPDGATRSVVVVATLVDVPSERLDTILANQIDSPEKFLRLVALLLGIVGGAVFPMGRRLVTRHLAHRTRRRGVRAAGACSGRPARGSGDARPARGWDATHRSRPPEPARRIRGAVGRDRAGPYVAPCGGERVMTAFAPEPAIALRPCTDGWTKRTR